MTLVIPAIDLRNGRCMRHRRGDCADETTYFEDPVTMAKLWRVQNARVLHVVDRNAGLSDDAHGENGAVIGRMCRAVDIPIQLDSRIRTIGDMEAAFNLGVYRVVLSAAAVRSPDLVSEAVERFSCSRVVVGLEARDGKVQVEGDTEGPPRDAVDLALEMERRGVRRIIYTDHGRDGTAHSPNLEAHRTLGNHLEEARVTASGSVNGYQDLLQIKELASYRVDSVIIGRSLYENRFPCQQFWCWHNPHRIDLDRFSTAPLR